MSGRKDQVKFLDIPSEFPLDAATLTNEELSAKYDRSIPQVVRWRRAVQVPSPVKGGSRPYGIPDPGAINWRQSGVVLIEGPVCVAPDWHVPYHNIEMAKHLVDTCKKRKITQLAIPGDFLNGTTLTNFDPLEGAFVVREEFAAGIEVLEWLLKQFKRVYWCAGNHEWRILRALRFQVDLIDVAGWLVKNDRLIVTPLPYMYVQSGGEKWRLTHPRSYSRVATSVAGKLTSKFDCNVMGAHGHLWGSRMSENGKYYAIDLGGLFDPEKIAYLNLAGDSTHPESNPGFWILEDGVPTGYNTATLRAAQRRA